MPRPTPQRHVNSTGERQQESDLKTYRTISVPVLIGTVIIAAAGGLGLYFWHGFQAQRGANALLAQAEELLANAKDQQEKAVFHDAASLIYRYTQIKPDDIDAHVRLAEVYEKGASDTRSADRAIVLLYEALGIADAAKQEELRRSLVDLLIEQGRYLEAEVEADKLPVPGGSDELDFNTARLRGLARFGRYQTGGIPGADMARVTATLMSELRKANALQADPEVTEILAFLLRREDPQLVVYPPAPAGDAAATAHGSEPEGTQEGAPEEAPADAPPQPMTREARVAEADQVMDRLVEQRPDDPLAWLVRSNYRRQHDLPGADEDLAQALQLGSDNEKVRLAVASNSLTAASAILQQLSLAALPAADQEPTPAAPEEQAKLDRLDQLEKARQLLQAAAENYQYVLDHIDGKNESALLGLGRAAVAQNDADTAIRLWTAALQDRDAPSFVVRYYLTELLLDQQQFDAANDELQVLEREVERFGMGSDRSRFERLKKSVELMRVRVLIHREMYAEALPLLERVAAGQPQSPADAIEHFQAYRLLGLCHEQAGRPDLAARSLEDAAEIAPRREDQATGLLAAAAAWERAGAIDNAIGNCQRAITLQPSPEASLLCARLLLNKQQQLPAAERDWTGLDTVMESLHQADNAGQLAADWRLHLLEGDVAVVRASGPEERQAAVAQIYQLARQAEEQHPADESLLRTLVFLYQRLDKPEDADRAVKAYQDQAADEVAWRVVQADLLSERQQFDQARAALEPLGTDLTPANAALVAKTKARIALAAGDPAEANRILKELAQTHPNDLTVARLRMQVVERLDDPEARRALEAELLGGDQQDKTWALVMKIRRLVSEAVSDRDAGFREAIDELNRLQTVRPSWSVVYALRGEAEEKRAALTSDPERQRGVLEQAARAYQRAVELGDRSIGIQERLINTLYRAGLFQDAAACLARIENAVPLSGALSEMAINIALQHEQQGQALDVARRAYESRPDDVMAQVWYGLMLLGADKAGEAEQVFLDAIKAAPQDDRTWNGLFTFYIRTDNKSKARETLVEMMKQAQMSNGRRAFVLAQGYEALGEDENAETAYREALKESPDEEHVRLRLIQFYVSRLGKSSANANYQDKAIALLQDTLRRNPNDGRAKRTLATLMAGAGGDQWKSAIEMLRSASNDAATPVMDRRLHGVLLFQRDGAENLAEARTIFEALIASAEAEPNDRLILARILERQGDLPGARAHYEQVGRQTPPDVRGLAFYVDFLIRHGDLPEAQRWLQTLTEARQGEFDAGTLELQARLLVAQGNIDAVAQQIDPPALQQLSTLAADPTAQKILTAQMGDIYIRLGLHAGAEPWYRRLAELDANQFAALARCLAGQNRIPDALDICQQAAAQSDSPAVVQAVADVLTSGSPSAADYERVEPILAAAEQKYGGDPNTLVKIANVRIIQGRLDDVIRLLEKVVGVDPKNVLALNNLASVMSERPALRSKALEYVDRAIDIIGPRPDLFDTKASIFLYEGQPAQAVELLEFAVGTAKKDPRYQFHLAAAYFGIGKQDEAARYYREAIADGLEQQVLTQPDRQLMTDMQGLLNSPSPEPTVPGPAQEAPTP